MRTVGYRQVWQYLENQISHGLMVEKALAATRQLAKRQLTWLRNQSGLVWFVGYNGVDLYSLDAYFAK
jgi:tRNA dimethylallyltransferase